MFRWILTQIKKVWCFIARPRIIKLESGGEVKLTNVPMDIADKLKDLLSAGLSESKSPVEVEAPEELPVKDEVVGVYTNTALGTFQDPNGLWCVAVIKYDPRTGLAKMQEVVKAGYEKADVEERFKILTMDKGILN